MPTMTAFGHRTTCAIDEKHALVSFETDVPSPGPRDLLVAVKGVSMNPVDVKVRALMAPEGDARILGYDAAGIVTAVGDAVTHFQPGDAVYYAGDLTRPGSNAEYQLVDERIAGKKPKTLSFEDAAAIPLTAITAWEILFDSFGLEQGDGDGDALLIIGGAGGVGSILIQLAKQLTKLKVIATASRPDTEAWVRQMGADHVVNHRKPLNEEMQALGVSPRFVAALTNTDQHVAAIVELIQPRGHIALIDDPQALDIIPLKFKAITLSWEFMFTRSMFETPDMIVQHQLLNRVAEMIDTGILQSTANRHGGALSVENLIGAHAFQESGKAIGKTVLSGLDSRVKL